MTKNEEDKLMSDFFRARRQERSEENEMLQDQLEEQRQGVDRLVDKEFVGGGVLDRWVLS
jgi:hypothetical protein